MGNPSRSQVAGNGVSQGVEAQQTIATRAKMTTVAVIGSMTFSCLHSQSIGWHEIAIPHLSEFANGAPCRRRILMSSVFCLTPEVAKPLLLGHVRRAFPMRMIMRRHGTTQVGHDAQIVCPR